MGAPAEARARHSIATPTARPGAIAVVSIHAQDMDAALTALGLPRVGIGHAALADLLGVDEGLVVRWSQTRVDLTPHAGRRIVRALSDALAARGVPGERALSPEAMYPEARTPIEARMLDALARAASPRAIDLLLDQPRRWTGTPEDAPDARLADARTLSRLIDPALVVAVGPPNVGKSTLVNALAGRDVSIVADEPGVTRDAVGALLELDGLCVRYLDAPGISGQGTDELGARAARAARSAIAQAEIVLSCHDATSPALEPRTLPVPAGVPTISVNTRSDLGEPRVASEARVSVIRAEGIDDLARLVRRRLVPDEALEDPRPWRFWAETAHRG